MKASVRITAEPIGFTVWIASGDGPDFVTTHSTHGHARMCAEVIAKRGGCGSNSTCTGCRALDLPPTEELAAALRALPQNADAPSRQDAPSY